ncbi:unnamed protein product [Prunus armeniaca]
MAVWAHGDTRQRQFDSGGPRTLPAWYHWVLLHNEATTSGSAYMGDAQRRAQTVGASSNSGTQATVAGRESTQ